MKRALEKIKVSHLVIAVLLFASLWFPSAREAHSLCFRLLMHLRGDTFVQGQPPGCMIYTIPNVQFTEKHRQELRAHSKDSLDAFILAMATTGGWMELEPPSAESSWTNHALIQWAAFCSTSIALKYHPETNVTSLASTKAAHEAVRLAQLVNPTNGALWLAQACLNFQDREDSAALTALRTAITNKDWNADSAAAFNCMTPLYKAAGLSGLDATLEANANSEPSILFIQGKCRENLARLMTQSLNSGNDTQFQQLVGILTELRRAEWIDGNVDIFNAFRRLPYDDDLINAMAKRIGHNPLPDLSTNYDVNYKAYNEARPEIFQTFFDRLPDQKLAGIYLEQGKAFRTESKLRRQMNDRIYMSEMWANASATIGGLLSPTMLTLLALAIGIDLINMKLKKRMTETDKGFFRNRTFWMVGLLFIILGSLILTNLGTSLGLDSEVGLRLIEPPPLISPVLKEFIGAFVICVVLFSYVTVFLLEYRKNPEKTERLQWLPTLTVATAYLVSILAMALFRWRVVEDIAARFPF